MKNKVIYYYSACVGIIVGSLKILCDPWFTDGAYYGSWYQYPKFETPIDNIPEYEYIYISHLHEDHFDSQFLKKYQKKWPNSKIIITERKFNYLAKLLKAGNFSYISANRIVKDNAIANLIPYGNDKKEEIDSVLEVISLDSNYRLLNLNDVPYDIDFHKSLSQRPYKINCMLAGYSGAGPYPQTYFDTSDPVIKIKAIEKQERNVNKFLSLCEIYNAKCNIPFAGTYFLGGKLSYLNEYRGVPDPIELKKYRKDIVVPSDGGKGYVLLDNLECKIERSNEYNRDHINQYLNQYENTKYSFEKQTIETDIKEIDFPKMIDAAFLNAKRKFIKSNKISCQYEFNFGNSKHVISIGSPDNLNFTIWQIFINENLLYGILKGYYHWDTAEIGSHIVVRRTPDISCRNAHKILCFMRI